MAGVIWWPHSGGGGCGQEYLKALIFFLENRLLVHPWISITSDYDNLIWTFTCASA